MTGGQPTYDRPLSEQFQLLEYSRDAILLMDMRRVIVFWNGEAARLYGFAAAEALDKCASELLRPRGSTNLAEVDAILERYGRWDGELTCTRRDGADLQVESRQVLVREPLSGTTAILQMDRDISATGLSDEAILEIHRLESLGLLAGGIGHCFNNLLTGILGNVSLAIEQLQMHRVRFLLEDALHSAESAAHLTGQMLALAGKPRLTRERILVPELVRESLTLVQPSITRDARVVFDLNEDTPAVEGDRVRLQQLMTIMLLNAGEALTGDTGVLRLASGVRHFSGNDFPAETRGAPRPGRYSWIRVADNGAGVDADIKRRIFEPFFSTKAAGRGLGLPAALAIVRSHGGFLAFETTPGQGTTFDIFLPARE